jgi:3-methyladenine DNA glycosylase AlkD
MDRVNTRQAMANLKAMGDEKRRAFNAKRGAGDNQFGVKTGDIRKLAKQIKTDHELGLSLWQTGNVDAQMLAILLVRPKDLSTNELSTMVKEGACEWVADWLSSYVLKKHPDTEKVREKWMKARDVMTKRAGWSLTAQRVVNNPDELDFDALLDRIEKEMPKAKPQAQWTMNTCLGEIGIHHEEHRDRVLAVGEAIGFYRDVPCPKGCTSPYVPIWVNAMVSRQKA